MLNLSAASVHIPEYKEVNASGKDYVQWGKDNLFPQYLFSLYIRSTILQALVNGIADYVDGDAIILGDNLKSFETYKNAEGDTIEDIVRKMTIDYLIYGGFAASPVFLQDGKMVGLYHFLKTYRAYDLTHITFKHLCYEGNHLASCLAEERLCCALKKLKIGRDLDVCNAVNGNVDELVGGYCLARLYVNLHNAQGELIKSCKEGHSPARLTDDDAFTMGQYTEHALTVFVPGEMFSPGVGITMLGDFYRELNEKMRRFTDENLANRGVPTYF